MTTLPHLSLSLMLLTTTAFLLAGLVKGVVGLGLPTLAMALLALAMPPAQAAALLILPSLVTNVWQMRPWPTLAPMTRRLWPMQAGVVVGTLGGAWLLGAPAGAWAMQALGAAVLVYGLWGLSGARVSQVPAGAERVLGPLVGAVTGLVTAATGVFVIPAVPYLQALGLSRDELVQTMGLSFTVSTVARASGTRWRATSVFSCWKASRGTFFCPRAGSVCGGCWTPTAMKSMSCMPITTK